MSNAFDAKKFSFQNPLLQSDDSEAPTSGRVSHRPNIQSELFKKIDPTLNMLNQDLLAVSSSK